MRKGVAVSPGVAVGRAYCVHAVFVGARATVASDEEARQEIARYEKAREQTALDLRALYHKVAKQVGEEEAGIFLAHETILHDAALTSRVHEAISSEHLSAAAALERALHDYSVLFARTKDEYLRDRVNDLRDVIVRLSGHLSEMLQPDGAQAGGPLILVADELLPSQVVTLGEREVAGIVTQRGSRTSHAAILARSRGIPAVSGVRGVLRQVENGDLIVVDGREGHVIIKPDAEVEKAYRKLQREFVDLKDALAENRDEPALTADGEPIELLANINHLADARAAIAMGASGVGLYRTEYLFLTHPDVPDEEEQLAAYRKIIDASPRHRVTIRTLDLGGDKSIPYLGHDQEANPFMGWRSIRLSFEHPEFFMTQIRAVLRAAADVAPGQVRLMFPMITTLEELRRVRSLVHRASRQLTAEGKPQGAAPIGLMLEVPAAAITLESMLGVADFVSIGSNDLVQYLMAADRDNPKVSHLCQPLSPPVLRLLTQVIQICNARRKPVTLCGEMAGAPRAIILLLGMGLRSFSMSPAFIPTAKKLIGQLTRARAQQVLNHTLGLKTMSQIQKYLTQQLEEISPSLMMLDSE